MTTILLPLQREQMTMTTLLPPLQREQATTMTTMMTMML
jgi:hypothetical protein